MGSKSGHSIPLDIAVHAITSYDASGSGRPMHTERWESQHITVEDIEESAQFDPDSNRTHVTDTQLDDMDLLQDETLVEMTEETLPDATQHLRQIPAQDMIRKTQFTRPASSHQDPNDGFAFGKPKPIQALNFGLKSIVNASAPIPRDLPRLSPKINEIPLTQAPHFISNPYDASITHQPTITPPTAIEAPVPEVLPCITSGVHQVSVSLDSTRPPTTVCETSTIRELSEATRSPTEISAPQKSAQSPIQTKKAAALEKAPSSPLHGSQISVHDCSPLRPLQASVSLKLGRAQAEGNRPHTPQRSHRAPSNVSKSRRKPKATGGPKIARNLPQNLGISPNPSDEDLLSLLIFRYRREQQERDAERARRLAKDAELEDIKDVSNLLHRQLQTVQEREKVQQVELRKLHAIMPKWENRIQKLKDYVKGLTNDHNRLRDGAKHIDEQRRDVAADKSVIGAMLGDAHHAVELSRSQCQHILDKAKHQIVLLSRTIEDQEIRLQEDTELLQVERDRNQRLEDELSRITDSHRGLIKASDESRKALEAKLDEVLSQNNVSIVPSQSNSEVHCRDMLTQCIYLLQEVRNTDVVKPHDLRKLDQSIKSYAKKISTALQACVDVTTSNEVGQQTFAIGFQEQLRCLSASIQAEHDLGGQMMDLREAKATLRERLQMTETVLNESRKGALVFQGKEQVLLQKISALEIEVATSKNHPTENPLVLIRLQELELENRNLEGKLESQQKQSTELLEQHQRRVEESVVIQASLDDIRLQLEDANVQIARLQTEKSACEADSRSKCEEMNKQFSKASNLEKAKVESQHRNQIQQLQCQKASAEAKANSFAQEQANLVKQHRTQVLQLEEQVSSTESRVEVIWTTRLQKLQEQKDKAEAQAEELSAQTAKVTADLNAIRVLQQEWTEAEVRTKEAHEKALQHANKQKEAAEAKMEQRIRQLDIVQGEKNQEDDNSSQLRTGFAKLEIQSVEKDKQLANLEDELRKVVERLQSSDAEKQMLLENNAAQVKKSEQIQGTAIGSLEYPKRRAHRSNKPNPTPNEEAQAEEVALLEGSNDERNHTWANSKTPYSYFRQNRYQTEADDHSPFSGKLTDFLGGSPVGFESGFNTPNAEHERAGIESRGSAGIDRRSPFIRPASKDRPLESGPIRSVTFENLPDKEMQLPRGSGRRPSLKARPPAQRGHFDQVSAQQAGPREAVRETKLAKRDAIAAGLSMNRPLSGEKRVNSVNVQGLGPVIPDSHLADGRRSMPRVRPPPKNGPKRTPTKDNKYIRRFSQEFE